MEKKAKFSKNFFTRIRPCASKKSKIDNISFKWTKSVRFGNEETILYSVKYKNKRKMLNNIYN